MTPCLYSTLENFACLLRMRMKSKREVVSSNFNALMKIFHFFTSVPTKMIFSESPACQWSSFLSGKVHNSLFWFPQTLEDTFFRKKIYPLWNLLHKEKPNGNSFFDACFLDRSYHAEKTLKNMLWVFSLVKIVKRIVLCVQWESKGEEKKQKMRRQSIKNNTEIMRKVHQQTSFV